MTKIFIGGEDYQRCDAASQNYWSNSKPGFFGRGIINTKDDPYRVTRTGILGEMALAKFVGIDTNIDYVIGGEQADLILPSGLSVDVKTASRDYGAALIRVESRKGRSVLSPAKMCDIYVGAYIESEDPKNEEAIIVLCGWLSKDEVIKLPTVPARVGDHKNKELKWETLRPIQTIPIL